MQLSRIRHRNTLKKEYLACVGLRTTNAARLQEAVKELVEARAHAERHAAELRSFFDRMTDGIVLHDAHGNVVLTNAAAKEILGAGPVGSVEERTKRYVPCNLDGTPM